MRTPPAAARVTLCHLWLQAAHRHLQVAALGRDARAAALPAGARPGAVRLRDGPEDPGACPRCRAALQAQAVPGRCRLPYPTCMSKTVTRHLGARNVVGAQVYGMAVAVLDEDMKITKLEIFYGARCPTRVVSRAACPLPGLHQRGALCT